MPRRRSKKNTRLKEQPDFTLEKIFLGGIGSFLLVMFFPHGVKYFFRNVFAEIVRAVVTIILTALLTEKLAEKIAENRHNQTK